jgi:protein-disulfide isomerase
VRFKLLTAAALAAVLSAGLVACGGSDSAGSSATPIPGATQLTGVPQDGVALGSPDAPRTLAVYADLQCPYCREWDEGQLPGIVEQHVRAGDVRVEFRGLAFIGPESDLGLRAALAAGMQNHLWGLVNVLYANQGGENAGWLTEDSLRSFAGSVRGLDVDRMLADMQSDEVAFQMEKARAAAAEAGVNSTPSFQVGPTGGTLTVVGQDDLHEALAR